MAAGASCRASSQGLEWSTPQSVSVVGERRIGKSSLLFQISVPEVQDKYLSDTSSDASSLIVIFLDFQQMRNITLEDFFAALSGQIRRVDPEIAGPESTGYQAFKQVQERLSERNKRLVLLFDEFDAITLNSVSDRDFYAFLTDRLPIIRQLPMSLHPRRKFSASVIHLQSPIPPSSIFSARFD
jgi:hypothetical protein